MRPSIREEGGQMGTAIMAEPATAKSRDDPKGT